MSQDWQWYAVQLHGQAMLRFQEGWAAQYAAWYEQARVLYDEAYQLLLQSMQYSGYNTPHEMFYQLALCCVNVAEIQRIRQDPSCIQLVQQALSHLYQALQLSPNNPIYIQAIGQLQAYLQNAEQTFSSPTTRANIDVWGDMEASRETEIHRIMERVRQDPERLRRNEQVRQAMQRSGRVLESLMPGSTDPNWEDQWQNAEEEDLRKKAEDELTRRELREHITAENGSSADFDAALYILDQNKKQEALRRKEKAHEEAEAIRQRAYEERKRMRLQSESMRLGIRHPKPCSCWSCQQGYT